MKKISRDIFSLDPHKAHAAVEKDLSDVVKLLGRRSALVANVRESLLSLSRMLQYFLNNAATWMRGDLAAQFRSVMRDIKSLDDYTNQQTQEMTFLLESTLGLINIQQNQIIKIFTVASVLFMPPTLIASIYGMNVGLPAQKRAGPSSGDGRDRPLRHRADSLVQAEESALSGQARLLTSHSTSCTGRSTEAFPSGLRG
jgi:Mg2+ and Co2+ transporter CorA